MVDPRIHARIISRQHTALKAPHCVTFVYYVLRILSEKVNVNGEDILGSVNIY